MLARLTSWIFSRESMSISPRVAGAGRGAISAPRPLPRPDFAMPLRLPEQLPERK